MKIRSILPFVATIFLLTNCTACSQEVSRSIPEFEVDFKCPIEWGITPKKDNVSDLKKNGGKFMAADLIGTKGGKIIYSEAFTGNIPNLGFIAISECKNIVFDSANTVKTYFELEKKEIKFVLYEKNNYIILYDFDSNSRSGNLYAFKKDKNLIFWLLVKFLPPNLSNVESNELERQFKAVADSIKIK